ncbi:hypothetical protein M1O52_02445 [Dehalococcoidia bacterium]|nr:hypothetical protein [Dehalococcoidia bacterium]
MERGKKFAVERLRREGKRVGMIKLKTIWPFADSLIRDVGSRAKKIFVPEMNRGQIAGEIMKYTCCDIIPYNQTDGEVIYPNTIMGELRRLL